MPAIDHLRPFLGTWRTEGEILSGGDGAKLRATDVYEWFLGEQFMLHHVDGQMGRDPVRALEIMRHDRENDRLVSTAIDNGGQYATYRLSLEGRNWSILGETERFEGTFDADFNVLEGKWFQIAQGQPEQAWMHIRLVRTEGAR